MQQDSPIKLLHEYSRRNQIYLEYRFEKESGPLHAKTYTVRLHVGEKNYLATESTMKLAQLTAAQKALDDLKINSSPMTLLNTWAKRNHRSLSYRFFQEQRLPITSNRFRLIYHYRLYIDDDFFFDGYGCTHQQARLHCAQNAFYFLRSNTIHSPVQSPTKSSNDFNPLTKIYQLAQQRQTKIECVQLFDHENVHIQMKFGDKYLVDGYGKNKYLAKRSAAEILLEKFETNISLPPPPTKGLLKRDGQTPKNESKKHVHFDENLIDKQEQSTARSSPVSLKQQLMNYCQKLQINIDYQDEILNENSSSSRYQSSLSLKQNNQILAEYTGYGPNLMRAQENASIAAWNQLKTSNLFQS